MNPSIEHPIAWLEHAGQRLGLVPSLGGGVAAWQLAAEMSPTGMPFDIWRPWDGGNPDRYRLASFPMVPWSNRISGGGFEFDGKFHTLRPNRKGEPYPIHGDGWLQPWAVVKHDQDTLVLTLGSNCFEGNPYAYSASQTFTLVPGGLDQTLAVTHQGTMPLPYGLGLHPWFLRTPQTQLQAGVTGAWFSGTDSLPTEHTRNFPATWNLNEGINANGTLIDNAFTGWSGQASITWPEHHLRLSLQAPEVQARAKDDLGYCLLYRPEVGSVFCFEPVTHPVDAFHAKDYPGLQVLSNGESLELHVQWRIETIA